MIFWWKGPRYTLIGSENIILIANGSTVTLQALLPDASSVSSNLAADRFRTRACRR